MKKEQRLYIWTKKAKEFTQKFLKRMRRHPRSFREQKSGDGLSRWKLK